ncbi:hypothetical protein DUI87_16053 [Hirundo rustica rustica]|uniref:Uncharacterized protein n=1 Tax=Hirundo rustica rustica TaxID=333673 RepID=A0A3M0K0D1_HIRRU|nr:hypothetical protein DUI87_16053 [Hirundo rustica rustica]
MVQKFGYLPAPKTSRLWKNLLYADPQTNFQQFTFVTQTDMEMRTTRRTEHKNQLLVLNYPILIPGLEIQKPQGSLPNLLFLTLPVLSFFRETKPQYLLSGSLSMKAEGVHGVMEWRCKSEIDKLDKKVGIVVSYQ